MNTIISKEKYPFEMYCTRCDHVAAYLEKKPEIGEPIRKEGTIKINGEYPIAGEEIQCNCKLYEDRTWWARERTDTKISECCKAEMIGDVQCENCGSNGTVSNHE